ncbi:osmolarity response regulator transcription factor OmpR [Chitinimonas sp. BJB300]|uniref:osmolarity response regulator transcription factor OmpR n=1 Tax=Chitinimonas sp. BJB300 TaxID=1559339 RepID=UPI000C0C8703|nr:two-component system response regulator OmpR [Chitinimonas sp. BJB300]PHV13047.1 two-component system response regulator OmpR [Chitinimonas sp. BJB300]TSJ87743.1 two-component system response regulator OmpR [Chitinimonas sp. BJB300]
MNTAATPSKKILLIDDDPRLRELVQRYLNEQGLSVEAFADASKLEGRLQRNRPQLLLLDLMMPGEDGLSVCRRLRALGDNIPIIMLTARGDDIDRIIGLEMGADDYLPKPFNPRELLARINAVLRRHKEPSALAAPLTEGEHFDFGPFRLEISNRKLMRDNEPIPLTNAEFALLRVFASHPRQPLSRERLMELARGREHEAFDRSIDVQVSRLRKLIESHSTEQRYLQTVWGFGYVFVPDGGER